MATVLGVPLAQVPAYGKGSACAWRSLNRWLTRTRDLRLVRYPVGRERVASGRPLPGAFTWIAAVFEDGHAVVAQTSGDGSRIVHDPEGPLHGSYSVSAVIVLMPEGLRRACPCGSTRH